MNTPKNATGSTVISDAHGVTNVESTPISSLACTSSRTKLPRVSRGLDLIRDTRGANLVEYIIVVGLVALIAIVGFKTFGSKVKDKIEGQSTSISGIQQ